MGKSVKLVLPAQFGSGQASRPALVDVKELLTSIRMMEQQCLKPTLGNSRRTRSTRTAAGIRASLEGTATGNANGNSGKGEACTIIPNVYSNRTRPRENKEQVPYVKNTKKRSKNFLSKKIFKKSRNNTKIFFKKQN